MNTKVFEDAVQAEASADDAPVSPAAAAPSVDARLGAFVRTLATQLDDSPKSFLANVLRAITDLDSKTQTEQPDERAASDRYSVLDEAGDALLKAGYHEAYEVVYRLMKEARATQQATKGDERAAHSYADDPERQWTEFWAPICAPNGVIDLEQVKRELSDYSMLLDYVPRVYDHATGGAVSKPNTKPTAVCSEIDNHIQNLVEAAINDDRESRAAVPQAEQRMSGVEQPKET